MSSEHSSRHQQMLARCIELAEHSAASGGGPFAAIVAKDGQVIAEASNSVTLTCDPTAHAEINAIRQACKLLQSHQLPDCTIYSSCEPCPMCLGAIYWARPNAVYFAASRAQAASAGFDDSLIYQQVNLDGASRAIPFQHLATNDAERPFSQWRNNTNKVDY